MFGPMYFDVMAKERLQDFSFCVYLSIFAVTSFADCFYPPPQTLDTKRQAPFQLGSDLLVGPGLLSLWAVLTEESEQSAFCRRPRRGWPLKWAEGTKGE